MANEDKPNSGGCQWFITVASRITSYDGSYTVFGQVVEGQDVVKAISRVPGKHLAQWRRPSQRGRQAGQRHHRARGTRARSAASEEGAGEEVGR